LTLQTKAEFLAASVLSKELRQGKVELKTFLSPETNGKNDQAWKFASSSTKTVKFLIASQMRDN
jgi:hypothetical protein